ncbi:MAG: hypothetical protein JSV35_06615 [Candidatus Bathyarchaeota archaeon]|nr:MAG: hypothetical protein JSV35_06615 [Candidatus Bathyarchaeota archaeon]
MKDEKERLYDFLISKLGDSVSKKSDEITVDTRTISVAKFKQLVNKFDYRRNFINRYWVELRKDEIRINTFTRREESKENKKGTLPSIIKHGF